MDIDQWVHLYADDLLRWANTRISNKETARDLVQDTFLSALNSRGSFKGESSPKTWLFSILNNKIMDHYRSSKKGVLWNETATTQSAESVSDELFDRYGNWEVNGFEDQWNDTGNLLDNNKFVQVMDHCMEDLPEQWRHLLQHKYLLDKNADDICQEHGLSKSNYWQILHRAKLLMKQCLEVKWFKSQRS